MLLQSVPLYPYNGLIAHVMLMLGRNKERGIVGVAKFGRFPAPSFCHHPATIQLPSYTDTPHDAGTGLGSNTAANKSLITFSWLFLPASLIWRIFSSACRSASCSACLFPCVCYSPKEKQISLAPFLFPFPFLTWSAKGGGGLNRANKERGERNTSASNLRNSASLSAR